MTDATESSMAITSTFMALLMEFGTAQIPLSRCCKSYFNCELNEAKRRAKTDDLPVPAYKLVQSQKAQYFVSARDLAEHIDSQLKAAAEKWELERAVRHEISRSGN